MAECFNLSIATVATLVIIYTCVLKQGKHSARKPPKHIILVICKTSLQAPRSVIWKLHKLRSSQARKLTSWHVDRLPDWQNEKSTEWRDDNMTAWLKDRMTKVVKNGRCRKHNSVRAERSSIEDLVLMRTKLLNWSSFSPHLTQKVSFSLFPHAWYISGLESVLPCH